MIVKKMPILQGFPDFESVKKLSISFVSGNDFHPVFYDIETTGLSQYSTFLYLIGAIVWEDGQWVLYQWFAENETDEPELLKAFAAFVKKYTCTIQYNGDRFDQPYLETRYKVHALPSPFDGLSSLDLYRELKQCKDLLKLPQMKQPDLESFLQLSPRLFCDGREGIRAYRKYMKSHQEDLLRELLGHNQEDLLGLLKILEMLSYRIFFDGGYQPEKAEISEGLLILSLKLPLALPKVFSNGNRYFYISGEKNAAKLLIPLTNGRLRQYYADYRQYDYLPAEDTAIPKALSIYMDKSLRVPAKPDTCYTWFSCDKAFLTDPQRQMQYLKHTLPYLLNTLKK